MNNRTLEEAVLNALPNMDSILSDRAKTFIADHVGSKEAPKSISLIKYLTQIIDLDMAGQAAPESIGLPGTYRYHKTKGLTSLIQKEITALAKENETAEQVWERLNKDEVAYKILLDKVIQTTTSNMEKARKEWESRFAKRLDVIKSYMEYTNNLQENIDQMHITQINKIQNDKDQLSKEENSKFAKLDSQRKDGGQWAMELSKQGKVLVWIAGNAESLGGSTIRPFKTGDAQEEKLAENLPVCFATAAKLGCEVKCGDIDYPKEYAKNLFDKGALLAQNIYFKNGENHIIIDAVTVAAPNIEPDKALDDLKQLIRNSSIGETDINDPKWNLYIKKIYTMFNNLCAATAKALKAGDIENILFTLAGSGVYSANSLQAKLIQGYCFRLAIENYPVIIDKIQEGKVHLPYPDDTVMAAFLLDENKKFASDKPDLHQAFEMLSKRIMSNVSELVAEKKLLAKEKTDQKRMAGALFVEIKEVEVKAKEEVALTIVPGLINSIG